MGYNNTSEIMWAKIDMLTAKNTAQKEIIWALSK
jgi:hypothetical protein